MLLIILFEYFDHLNLKAIVVPLMCTVQSAAIAYLICSLTLVRQGIGYWLLNRWLLIRVGILSYGIYLWQELFLVAAHPGVEWWRRYPNHLLMVGVVSITSYYLIEKPFLRFKGKPPRRDPLTNLPDSVNVIKEGASLPTGQRDRISEVTAAR